MRGGRLVLVVYLSKDSSLYPRDGTLNLNDVEISTRDSVSLPREEKQIWRINFYQVNLAFYLPNYK